MPEGDALHRAAQRLQALVGERVEAESPHPRAQATGVAPRIDGRRLEAVEAVGKNLFLRFEGGVTVRSHLRMSGRWTVSRVRLSGSEPLSRPWLVLRGGEHEAVLRNGPVLEIGTRPRLGPDVLTGDLEAVRLRGPIGEALLDQRQVAGIGNLWRAEALRHADPLARPGRRQPHRLLVPWLPGRRRTARQVTECYLLMRAPHLYETLRCFCLGAFAYLQRELSEGAELQFAFEEHASLGRPSLYEYKPLARTFVEDRASALARREDARIALDELLREPAARIFARAHAGSAPDEDRALLASVLMPLLTRVTETCGGFDWDDSAFDRAYVELESALFRESHGYAAVAPLVGLSAAGAVELGPGLRVRHAATGEFATYWPEANGLLPPDFGREPDRLLVIEFERDLDPGAEEAPDAPAEIADAITAIRLATEGAVAAGPVLFERLDWRPYGIRPVVPIAATVPAGEETRLDQFRGALARDLHERLVLCDEDPELGEALDRWELSLFQDEPFRSEQLRQSLTALLGGTDGLWAAGLRAALLLRLKEPLEEPDGATVRRALVEVLVHGDRASLVRWLDDAALGLRPGPVGYFAKLASAGPQGATVAA